MRPLLLTLIVSLCLTPAAHAGWNFDTGLTPEAARDLLTGPAQPTPPAGSWLRVRDMVHSEVRGADGTGVPPWPGTKPAVTLVERRAALAALRARGYRLIALLRWPETSWVGGVRPDQPLRRLPLDLREAGARSRELAAAYGDLIDGWEIENEPDISFVEENPETYAAFLKACYLGLKPEETGDRRRTTDSGLVLMGAFALPPGPYFDAWAANDGLRYTDGFNYHYYGYAEDFTGVYAQFRSAVTTAPSPDAAGSTVFQTRFYPASAGWQAHELARFDFSPAATAPTRDLLLARPLARGEPVLEPAGRWLVSPGTSVREAGGEWEFTVSAPAPGPLRPAMAELPLPPGTAFDSAALLAFAYRSASAPSSDVRPSPSIVRRPPATLRSPSSVLGPPSSALRQPPSSAVRRPSSALRPRALPIFLTEYGYGLLSAEAAATAAGRADQRAWFEAVRPQIRQLGIGGALAFLLSPYLEAGHNEFGLLQAPPPGTKPAAGAAWGGRIVSPALAALLAPEKRPAKTQTWDVATAPPAPVVIDFVGGPDLTMAKSHRGYLLQREAGAGRLVVYHFGAEPVTGTLTLEGAAWCFSDGTTRLEMQLAPGERRELPVTIRPVAVERFGPQVATARFAVGTVSLALGPTSDVRPLSSDVRPPSSVLPAPSSALRPPASSFEVYVRTRNGNLYQTWPRLEARDAWQWYVEPLANFTPAFFGRAYLPTALTANQPAALVFFFRPEKYPVIYRVRQAGLLEFRADGK